LSDRQGQIEGLKTDLEEATGRAGRLEASFQEQDSTVSELRDRVSQGEATIRDLTGQIEERNQTVGQLELTVSDGHGQIEGLKTDLEEATGRAGRLESSLQEREEELTVLRSKLQEVDVAEHHDTPTVAPHLASESPDFVARTLPSTPDDLTRIEGIGPKISSLIQADGITTFARLAQTEVSRLKGILDEAGPRFRLADPATWPEQASLAANGEWDRLSALQDQLKAGRDIR